MTLFTAQGHLSDEALLLHNEREITQPSRNQADSHLRGCASCQRRAAGLRLQEEALARTDAQVSPVPAHARGLLAARLAVEASEAPQSAWRRNFALRSTPGLLLRFTAVAALLACAFVFRRMEWPLQDRMAAYEETGPEPNPMLTPGSVDPVALTELCSRDDENLDPTVSEEKTLAVFRAYGMDQRKARSYQVDYLINPQLGGNAQIRNLWPEPYHATVWNAQTKDALETRLHMMVCNGQIDLATAQQQISTDWIAAYKRYFHSSRPVKTVAKMEAVSAYPR